MHIHYVQHVPYEGPAAIAEWARRRGHSLSGTHLFRDEPFPEPESFDLLVVLGGPMSVQDESVHPWLKREKRFLEKIIKSAKPILGICLGAQLLAAIMGAAVRKNPVKEIGWFPVSLTPLGWNSPIFGKLPPTFEAFHWHGDTFEIPDGAFHIATSKACRNQAFQYDERIVGVQFHLESTAGSVKDLVRHCGDELCEKGDYVQQTDIMGTHTQYGSLQSCLTTFLDSLAEMIISQG